MSIRSLMTGKILYEIRSYIRDTKRLKGLGEHNCKMFRECDFNPIIMLCGHNKSGSTHIHFAFLNLLNQVEPFMEGPVTFEKLRELEQTPNEKLSYDRGFTAFPLFVRTHEPYNRIYKKTKLIHVYRNPLDVMVSLYHYKVVHRVEAKKISFDQFLEDRMEGWCNYMRTFAGKKCFTVSYEDMKYHPYESFNNLFIYLGLQYTDEQLVKAIELSSFESVSKLESKSDNPGMTDRYRDGKLHFDGRFTRSGKVGQWKEFYSDSQLAYCREMMDIYKLSDYYNFIYE